MTAQFFIGMIVGMILGVLGTAVFLMIIKDINGLDEEEEKW